MQSKRQGMHLGFNCNTFAHKVSCSNCYSSRVSPASPPTMSQNQLKTEKESMVMDAIEGWVEITHALLKTTDLPNLEVT